MSSRYHPVSDRYSWITTRPSEEKHEGSSRGFAFEDRDGTIIASGRLARGFLDLITGLGKDYGIDGKGSIRFITSRDVTVNGFEKDTTISVTPKYGPTVFGTCLELQDGSVLLSVPRTFVKAIYKGKTPEKL